MTVIEKLREIKREIEIKSERERMKRKRKREIKIKSERERMPKKV